MHIYIHMDMLMHMQIYTYIHTYIAGGVNIEQKQDAGDDRGEGAEHNNNNINNTQQQSGDAWWQHSFGNAFTSLGGLPASLGTPFKFGENQQGEEK